MTLLLMTLLQRRVDAPRHGAVLAQQHQAHYGHLADGVHHSNERPSDRPFVPYAERVANAKMLVGDAKPSGCGERSSPESASDSASSATQSQSACLRTR